MNRLWLLGLFGITIFWNMRYSHQLTCCTGSTELKITFSTDDDQVPGTPCTNRGTSCNNVNCSTNTCTEDYFIPDTNCTDENVRDCPASWTAPTCRLLYYQLAKDPRADDEDEDANSVGELDIEFTYHAKQDCFDNSLGDVKIGCEFYQKIFYTDQKNRVIFEKECFCNNADKCNSDLPTACLSAEKETIKKPEDLCVEQGTSGTSRNMVYKVGTYFVLIIYFCFCGSLHFVRPLVIV